MTDKVCSLFDFIGNGMPLEYFNKALRYINLPEITVNMISKTLFMTTLTTIVAGLSLPIRSICYTLWYKTMSCLKDGVPEQKSKKQKKSQKNEE